MGQGQQWGPPPQGGMGPMMGSGMGMGLGPMSNMGSGNGIKLIYSNIYLLVSFLFIKIQIFL